MAETPLLERLTASDLFLLLWDDYGWSTDIGGLAILDGTSLLDRDGRVRIEAVREQLEPRLHLVPRFRQLLYRPRLGLGWPPWVDAPRFDLADRIRVHPVAAPGGQAQLLQACGELARRRLDPARPLWELWLLPGLPDRRVGAFLRLHHAVADGAAALAAFGALLDPAPSAPAPGAPPWTPAPIPTASELLADNLRRRRQEVGRGCSGLAHPGRTLRQARQAWPAWREVLTEHLAPHTSLNHPVGAGRRLAIIRGRLDLTRQIAVIRDIILGLLIAGAVAAWVPDSFWRQLFLTGHPLAAQLWGPVIGPVISLLSFVCSIGNAPLAAVLWNGGISFGGVVAFIFADLIIIPILIIYRKYYGTKMMLALLGIFYATMVTGGYIIEFTFGGLGLVPAERTAKVTDTGITWNYTTILNIIFLLVAAALVIRFVRSGSAPMLKMMGGSPTKHEHHAHGHSEVLPHRDAQPAQQSLQTQISDHQNRIAVPSMGMAPAPMVRSRD